MARTTTTVTTTTTDADAPIVLYLKRQHSAKRSRAVVARVWLVALAGTCQHVQHLHDIATKDSRPEALQRTVSQLRQGQQQYREGTNNNTDHKKNDSSAEKIAGRSAPERDSHPNNKLSTTTAAATTKTTTDTMTITTTMVQTTTTDADAPIVLYLKRQHSANRSSVVAARISLVAMVGCRLQRVQQQHLHEIVKKDSRPTQAGALTIPRRNQQQHRTERRTAVQPTQIACNHSQGRPAPERDSHPTQQDVNDYSSSSNNNNDNENTMTRTNTTVTTTTTTSLTQTHRLFST